MIAKSNKGLVTSQWKKRKNFHLGTFVVSKFGHAFTIIFIMSIHFYCSSFKKSLSLSSFYAFSKFKKSTPSKRDQRKNYTSVTKATK